MQGGISHCNHLCLHTLSLLERVYRWADRLSGGEKQRVAIAWVISQQPTRILADGPVASLDPELAWQMMGDLAGVAREHQVLTSISIHQVTLARGFADRIVGVAQGQVAYDRPTHRCDDAAMDRVYHFDQAARPAHPPGPGLRSAAFMLQLDGLREQLLSPWPRLTWQVRVVIVALILIEHWGLVGT